MLLETKNIVIRREAELSLSFPDMMMSRGQSILLLGASGCGKTTFLSILAGLLKPDQGQVVIDGQDFYALNSVARDHVRGQRFGFVFQTLHLLPSLTLSQNVQLAADMAGVKPEDGRLVHLLKTLGLADKAHRKPEALSQGEQQRAAIARAVLLKPDIIMADEPTSALDDVNAKAVMDLLEAQAKDTGAALLIATHDGRIIDRFQTVINLENKMEAAA